MAQSQANADSLRSTRSAPDHRPCRHIGRADRHANGPAIRVCDPKIYGSIGTARVVTASARWESQQQSPHGSTGRTYPRPASPHVIHRGFAEHLRVPATHSRVTKTRLRLILARRRLKKTRSRFRMSRACVKKSRLRDGISRTRVSKSPIRLFETPASLIRLASGCFDPLPPSPYPPPPHSRTSSPARASNLRPRKSAP